MHLEKKVAIITGAATGIGQACATTFAREGATVVVADRHAEDGEATAAAIRTDGGNAAFHPVDIAEPSSVAVLMDATIDQHGQVDILVCNAGVGGRSLGDGPVHECSVEGWDAVMNVNLRGTFLTCKYAIPLLMERGGSIITLSSVLGMVGTQGLFDTHAYTTSKAGIIGLTRSIATHYAGNGIRANVIAPGLVDTRMATRTKATPELAEQVAFWQPLGRLGRPTDVAAAALFLASDEAQFITGVVLPVDGGWTAQ